MVSQNNQVIAQNIRQIRKHLGMTLEQFGEELVPRADKSLVSKWELGKTKPSSSRLKQIAQLGNMSVMFLTTGNKSMADLIKNKTPENQAIIGDIMLKANKDREDIIDTVFETYFATDHLNKYSPRERLALIQYAKYLLNASPDEVEPLSFFANYVNVNGYPPKVPNLEYLEREKKELKDMFANLVDNYFSNARIKKGK
ncbi:MAG: helix-turn-helix transcriptional regulator [Lacticaseibacillus paracasei]